MLQLKGVFLQGRTKGAPGFKDIRGFIKGKIVNEEPVTLFVTAIGFHYINRV